MTLPLFHGPLHTSHLHFSLPYVRLHGQPFATAFSHSSSALIPPLQSHLGDKTPTYSVPLYVGTKKSPGLTYFTLNSWLQGTLPHLPNSWKISHTFSTNFPRLLTHCHSPPGALFLDHRDKQEQSEDTPTISSDPTHCHMQPSLCPVGPICAQRRPTPPCAPLITFLLPSSTTPGQQLLPSQHSRLLSHQSYCCHLKHKPTLKSLLDATSTGG